MTAKSNPWPRRWTILGPAIASMVSGCTGEGNRTAFPPRPLSSRILVVTSQDLTLSCKGELPPRIKGSKKMTVPLQCNEGTASAELEFVDDRVSYGRLFRPDGKSGNIFFDDAGTGNLLGLAGVLSHHP